MHLKIVKINKKLGDIFSQTNDIDDFVNESLNDIVSNIIYLPLTEMHSLNYEIKETIKDEIVK